MTPTRAGGKVGRERGLRTQTLEVYRVKAPTLGYRVEAMALLGDNISDLWL